MFFWKNNKHRHEKRYHKISKLNALAHCYLMHIDEAMFETKQDRYHLFGWSLGGQISLEIASILEQRGEKNINVYLLDTVLVYEELESLICSIDIQKQKSKYLKYLANQEYEESYVDRVLSTFEIENELIKQRVSSTLRSTKVVLFKAMMQDTRINDDYSKQLFECRYNLEYNHIDRILNNKSDITVIKVMNAHHGNILDQEQLLKSYLYNDS